MTLRDLAEGATGTSWLSLYSWSRPGHCWSVVSFCCSGCG